MEREQSLKFMHDLLRALAAQGGVIQINVDADSVPEMEISVGHAWLRMRDSLQRAFSIAARLSRLKSLIRFS